MTQRKLHFLDKLTDAHKKIRLKVHSGQRCKCKSRVRRTYTVPHLEKTSYFVSMTTFEFFKKENMQFLILCEIKYLVAKHIGKLVFFNFYVYHPSYPLKFL